jgi:hypothetical protein
VPGPFEYILWFLCTPFEVAALVCAYKKKALKRYFFLNLYIAGSLLGSLGRFQILHEYGLNSSEYVYFYYYSDALLTICLYFALTSLYSYVFTELKAERFVSFAALTLLLGTAIFSYAVVQQSSSKLVTHFVVELSQNLYFVGLILTYLLWASILKLRETRTRVIQLVLSLGVYFSLFAATYALRNLYPSMSSALQTLPPIIACFLPAAWAYAFWKLPEEARTVPSRLAVVPR